MDLDSIQITAENRPKLKTNYAVVAHHQGKVLCTCWYETPPSEQDIKLLAMELRNDDALHMTHLVEGKDYEVTIVAGPPLRDLKRQMQIPDEL